jgi:protein AroM
MATLGVLSIGQSPRTELTDDLRGWLPPGTGIVDHGVLDGLSPDEVDALAPRAGEDVLTTRLPDGSTVVLGARHVESRLPSALARLERVVDLVLLACTGAFHDVAHAKPLLTPDGLLTAAVVGLGARAAAVGVVCPLPDQVAMTFAKFEGSGLHLRVGASSPYTGSEVELAEVAGRLVADGAELLALDCIGYTDAHRRAAASAGVPVVLARSVAARLTAELLDGAA